MNAYGQLTAPGPFYLQNASGAVVSTLGFHTSYWLVVGGVPAGCNDATVWPGQLAFTVQATSTAWMPWTLFTVNTSTSIYNWSSGGVGLVVADSGPLSGLYLRSGGPACPLLAADVLDPGDPAFSWTFTPVAGAPNTFTTSTAAQTFGAPGGGAGIL